MMNLCWYAVAMVLLTVASDALVNDNSEKRESDLSTKLIEYRILLPMSVEEYEIAMRYSVAEFYKMQTGGGEGWQIIENSPRKRSDFSSAIPEIPMSVPTLHYTHKRATLSSKVPFIIRTLAPSGVATIDEKSYDAYPIILTDQSNHYMRENFKLVTVTKYQQDRGDTENIHNLSPEQLAQRQVITIDIANAQVTSTDYDEKYDPKLFKSSKTGRGQLADDWARTSDVVMCAYKLVEIKFNWWGLQDKVETLIQRGSTRYFTNFNRFLYCSMDNWLDLTMDDIDRLEDETKNELNVLMQTGDARGMAEL